MLQLAVQAAAPREAGGLGAGVIFIDTEKRFRAERVREIAAARFPAWLASAGASPGGPAQAARALDALCGRILVVEASSCEELLRRLESMEAAVIGGGTRLLVVDSVAALARSGTANERQEALGHLAAALKRLSETLGMAAVATNMVAVDVGGGGGPGGAGPGEAPGGEGGGGVIRSLKAALGGRWYHAVNTRLVLEVGGGARWLHVAKSPLAPPCAFGYLINATGLALIEGAETGPLEGAGGHVRIRNEPDEVRLADEAAAAAAAVQNL